MTEFIYLANKEEYLLRQIANRLRSQLDPLTFDGKPDVETLLTDELNWQNLYRAESLMIPHLSDAQLNVYWERALVEANKLKPSVRDFYHQTLIDEKGEFGLERKQSLLIQLLNDLNWSREQYRVKRLHESRMQRNVVIIFLFSFLLFFSPTLARLVFQVELDNLRIYYIFTAASSGFLGAAFSQLIDLKNTLVAAPLEQIKAMSGFLNTIARSMIGAGAGLIMFYLLQSGLMEGVLFPSFIQTAEQLQQMLKEGQSLPMVTSTVSEQKFQIGGLVKPAQGLSLLIVWCILSGFSEKLIPNLLEKNQSRLNDSKIKYQQNSENDKS